MLLYSFIVYVYKHIYRLQLISRQIRFIFLPLATYIKYRYPLYGALLSLTSLFRLHLWRSDSRIERFPTKMFWNGGDFPEKIQSFRWFYRDVASFKILRTMVVPEERLILRFYIPFVPIGNIVLYSETYTHRPIKKDWSEV